MYVDWQGVLTELHPGSTVIGRDLDCRIRFNDGQVSRRHVKFQLLDDGTVTIEDLKSTNGTLVNGEPLVGTMKLHDGDEVSIGSRRFHLRFEDGEIDDLASAKTEEGRQAELKPPKAVIEHPCPRCQHPVPRTQSVCPSCNYRPPFVRPGSITNQVKSLKLPEEDRRDQTRRSIFVPVCYASATLTFDGVARDLSRGGVFVESEFLDPVGTECQITALPEGAPSVTFAGRVAHVVDNVGQRCGLGVQFTKLGPEAESWLLRTLDTSAAH